MIYGGFFERSTIKEDIKRLEQETLQEGFWSNQRNSEKVISELNSLKKKYDDTLELKTLINDNVSLIDDIEVKDILESDLVILEERLDKLELTFLLSGEYDKCDSMLEIHSGAGGTESQDWASMLLRMYIRWLENNNFKYEIVDIQEGDEAGIKSCLVLIHGLYAYGYLKSEKGVHRLVRISPFDSNSRRHTSFAGVTITPIYEDDSSIEIKESDLKVDVFKSSGKGGQSVNTTDSAVRITHIPTGIVVSCQNERSQIQNRAQAMNILKSKLKEKEEEKKKEIQDKLKGSMDKNEFGSQIRSYVMCPYTMVKDTRTNVSETDVNKVLDGDIDKFINAYLKESYK
jgi:peptide chain release factor 2